MPRQRGTQTKYSHLVKQMTMMGTAQEAEAQLAQLVVERPDLFLIP